MLKFIDLIIEDIKKADSEQRVLLIVCSIQLIALIIILPLLKGA
tara:strand:+ start:20065 stop:20196 length:132 start_codon:yes stop_codon:yes gene_type:complete